MKNLKIAQIIISFILGVIIGIILSTAINNSKNKPEQHNLLFPMEEFIIQIKGLEKNNNLYLKLKIVLEASTLKDLDEIQKHYDKIRDIIYNYLYSLTVEDLNKSSTVYFLKEEITLRVNKILSPIKVSNILFQNFVIG